MKYTRHLLCFVIGSSLSASLSANPLPGTLDPAFGDHGVTVVTNSRVSSGSAGRPGLIAQAPSGALYVIGTTSHGNTPGLPQIAKVSADGISDLTFGTQGIAYPAFGPSSAFGATDAIVDDAGRLVVVGQMRIGQQTRTDIAACRFLADGSPDLTFGSDGCIGQALIDASSTASAVLIQDCLQPDTCIEGKRLLVAGWLDDGQTPKTKFGIVIAWKFDGSGVDTSFGVGGLASVAAFESKPTELVAMAEDASGRLVLAGNRHFGATNGSDMFAIRLTPSGGADTHFNGTGYRPLPFNAGPEGARDDRASSLKLLDDGKILIGGTATTANGFAAPAIARLRADGVPDPSFDGGHAVDEGRIILDLCKPGDCEAGAYDMDALEDGKILLAGAYAEFSSNASIRFMTVRVLPEGKLDPAFGSQDSDVGGLSLTSIDDEQLDHVDIATSLLLQGQNIVLSGVTEVGPPTQTDSGLRLAIVRLGNGDSPLLADGFEGE